jgi:hypothetical protein
VSRRFSIALTLQLLSAATLHAQPWVPPRGEGTVAVTYQNYYVTGHFDPAGRRNKNGATHSKALVAELDVGVTDTFAISISVPFIASKYTGPQEYFVGGHATHPGPLDDGNYHGTLQDIRVEARRVWRAGPVAVAPLVGAVWPTHDYETHGEAVPGRHRREVQIGGSAGADLDRIVPRTSVSARYALAVAERQHGFESVRSNLDLDADYGLARRIRLRGLASWQFRHKGPTIAELAADDWLGHDRFIVSSYVNAGGGVTLPITRNTDVQAVWIATVSGKDGAHVARMLAVGVSWAFGSGSGALSIF